MGASERAEPVAQAVPPVMRLAGLAVCGETAEKEREGGDEQRLATATDREGRGRALVSALGRALRKTPSPRKQRAFYPP